MLIAKTKWNDPYINLSTEEVILKDESITENVLLIYINQNTIVIGRNQNAHVEINSSFVEEKKIKIVRRVSGGGAVYQDAGNICFSFITQNKKNTYQKFLSPIIEFLRSLGLDAAFKGKNDLVVNGYKVSGNAQYIYKDKMFHHGTLLFDSDLSVLSKALNVNKLKLESKGIKSARQRVANVKSLLKEEMSSEEFTQKLIDFFKKREDSTELNLENYKTNEIKALSNVRKSYDWVYVKNPKFNIKNEKYFSGGVISTFINVEKNKIESIKFFGDFLSVNDFEKIEQLLLGTKYIDKIIIEKINSIDDFELYFGKLTKNEVIDLILGK
ncbi:MAG: lipoate--protein ligase [Mycoplasma sp.]|nr:lipoate--protein ligase [Mycoplasma sp.]